MLQEKKVYFRCRFRNIIIIDDNTCKKCSSEGKAFGGKSERGIAFCQSCNLEMKVLSTALQTKNYDKLKK